MTMSSTGSQLTLWRMRSVLLYYRKHHGAMGAWLAEGTETLWHALRAWKNAAATDPTQQAKAVESKTLVTLMRQAWQET
jgi:N-acetylglucosaminyl-diphospho-decaprenol L-rhamnosyltransferase